MKSNIRGKENPFENVTLAACLHISKETSVLINSLHLFGLDVHLVAANPLSSQNEISLFLTEQGIKVMGQKGETAEEYRKHISIAAHSSPDLILDDGGELHVSYASTSSNSCIGGTDETTSGTVRLKALDAKGKLRYPVIPVNEAKTKHIFDNKYGTGQSAVDGLIRATGLLLAGKTVVVAGYGWVGKGVAARLKGMGAAVVITEVDPVKALEANLDGFKVLEMQDAAKLADIILTCTGQVNVVGSEHFRILKDGALLGNVGHFDQEIDVETLFEMGSRIERVRENITGTYLTSSGGSKKIYLLCQGRVINLVAAEGHPPEVMQLSFANQLLSIHYLLTRKKELSRKKSKLLAFPAEIDNLVANLALRGFGLKIDTLTAKQARYSKSFSRS